ncbi:MAG: radical SAM protein [Methanosarcinales archaeon]|nr:radical SAM protein [Methanosarcinales archaeon]
MAGYNRMAESELMDRAARAGSLLRCCEICPRRCRVNRLQGERGCCRGGRLARVYSAAPHFGEEPPLVGSCGSGTIFLSGCNLSCVFCQNYEISQMDQGSDLEPDRLADLMIRLQDLGCHNINFVTPTHYVPQILEALVPARERGLEVPLVYNSGGYDSVETLRLLEGIFDIYMPDAKYGSDQMALKYSRAPGYVATMKAAIEEMHRQVGDLVIEDGIAVRGLLVRHLVLPGGLAGTEEVVRFLAGLSRKTYLNVMAQYRPEHQACQHPELDRRITTKEHYAAVQMAIYAGLTRGLTIY